MTQLPTFLYKPPNLSAPRPRKYSDHTKAQDGGPACRTVKERLEEGGKDGENGEHRLAMLVIIDTDLQQAAAKAEKAAKKTLPVGQGKKQDDIIGITTKKEEDFSAWYQEVVLKAEMIEYYQEVSPPGPPIMSSILVYDPRLTYFARFLGSSSCVLQACTSGMSSASGSKSVSRQWVWRRPAFPCSCPPSLLRRRRVSKLILAASIKIQF